MSDLRIETIDEKELDTILAEDIDFQGELYFEKPLMIKGRFKGEIKASGDLYIGQHATVEAQVEANIVSLRGTLRGNILARRRVELYDTACLDGDITAPDIVMMSGCTFNGTCTMRKNDELERTAT
jgi:cytoskeletal protein CcmA (bactofilin family)